MAQILLVDDNPDTCRLLVILLGRLGHEVHCVLSGSAALQRMEQHGLPNLMVLDYMMPQMNGIEVLKLLRASPETAILPVALYTANADAMLHQKAKQSGANDVWVKAAIGVKEMGERIDQLLLPPSTH